MFSTAVVNEVRQGFDKVHVQIFPCLYNIGVGLWYCKICGIPGTRLAQEPSRILYRIYVGALGGPR